MFDFNILTGVITTSFAIISMVVLGDTVFNVGRKPRHRRI